MSHRKLHSKSPCVVHCTERRTRLRVPRKHRKPEELKEAKHAIQKVPGVESVEINPKTGSILVQHEPVPGIIGDIGAAIEAHLPELMAALLLPEVEGAEIGFDVMTRVFKRYLLVPREQGAGNGTERGRLASSLLSGENRGESALRLAPAAFLAAGIWTLLREETLLGGLAPLALFYYAFDIDWKLKQEERTKRVESEAGMAADLAITKPGAIQQSQG
jgi:copper chaperone CopZ